MSKYDANQWVISALLTPETHAKLLALEKATGFSRSKVIRVLIANAKVNESAFVKDDGKEKPKKR
jgi:hypothetical protein